jgi:hypothetical protein
LRARLGAAARPGNVRLPHSSASTSGRDFEQYRRWRALALALARLDPQTS